MNWLAIDLNLLVVLDALIEEQSVTRAGARVGLSQPAVSNALGRLRALLEDPILERDGRRMRLTQRALEIKSPLRHAIRALHEAIDQPKPFDPGSVRREVRIFASDYISATILPLLVERLMRQSPGISLAVRWSEPSGVFDMLERESIDIAIGHFEDAPPKYLRSILFVDKPVCQGRKDHPAFKRWGVKAMVEHPLLTVSFTGKSFGWLDQALSRSGITAPATITLPHFLAAPLMLQNSDLLLITGERLARLYAPLLGLQWRPLPLPLAQTPRIEMLWDKLSDRDAALVWVRRQIVESAAELDKAQTAPATAPTGATSRRRTRQRSPRRE